MQKLQVYICKSEFMQMAVDWLLLKNWSLKGGICYWHFGKTDQNMLPAMQHASCCSLSNIQGYFSLVKIPDSTFVASLTSWLDFQQEIIIT